jgi:hypothetical protein
MRPSIGLRNVQWPKLWAIFTSQFLNQDLTRNALWEMGGEFVGVSALQVLKPINWKRALHD